MTRGGAGFFGRVGQKQKKSKYAYLLVDRNFQWAGWSTERVGRGLPSLNLKPPLQTTVQNYISQINIWVDVHEKK